MEYTYNDGLQSGSRRPRLFLVKNGEFRKFSGEPIPGICAIEAQKYEKGGKWSNTTYHLLLAPGVRAVYMVSPLHGMWGDDLRSWGETLQELQGLPIEAVKRLVRAEYPSTAERLDKAEEIALLFEEEGEEMETVIVSFGNPTRRAMADGWWRAPKRALSSRGVEVIIASGPTDPDSEKGNWHEPVVLSPAGARVISSKGSPGSHGGYYSVEVAVPTSAEPLSQDNGY